MISSLTFSTVKIIFQNCKSEEMERTETAQYANRWTAINKAPW